MSQGFPPVLDPDLVGSYPAHSFSGGGHVWDAVLEYRVWCHPERGAPDEADGDDYYCAFATAEEAFEFSKRTAGAEEPLALVLQEEFISEPQPGKLIHVKERRVTEWKLEWLLGPKRTIFEILSTRPGRFDTVRRLAGRIRTFTRRR